MFHAAHTCPSIDMKCAVALPPAVLWLPLPHPCCAYLELQGPPEQVWSGELCHRVLAISRMQGTDSFLDSVTVVSV